MARFLVVIAAVAVGSAVGGLFGVIAAIALMLVGLLAVQALD